MLRQALGLFGVDSIIIAVTACAVVGVFSCQGAPVILGGGFGYNQERLPILADLIGDGATTAPDSTLRTTRGGAGAGIVEFTYLAASGRVVAVDDVRRMA